MVNAQLATNGIHSESLIEAYKALPRENFVDEAQKPFVYMDEDIPAIGKNWLLEPMVEAKMIQEAVREQGASALFLGATNLFEGKVEAIDVSGRRVQLRTGIGISLWAGAHPETIAGLHEGGSARLSIRPEDIEIVSEDSAGESLLPVKLKSSAFLGSRFNLAMEIAGTHCRAYARSTSAFRDGRAFARVDPMAAWIVA